MESLQRRSTTRICRTYRTVFADVVCVFPFELLAKKRISNACKTNSEGIEVRKRTLDKWRIAWTSKRRMDT